MSNKGPNTEQHAQLLVLPASTMKLLTATVAWKVLGNEFRYATMLSHEDKRVHLHMAGDPSFSSNDLGLLLKQYKEVKGASISHLVIDDALFSGHSRGQGQTWNNIGMCYAPASGALNIDKNCVEGNIRPGELGQNAVIHISDKRLINLSANVKTVAKKTRDCQLDLHINDANHYHLSGCIAQDSAPIALRFSVDDLRAYFVEKLKRQLERHNIEVGRIEFAEKLPKLGSRVTHLSAPLPKLITVILQNSNNLYAESLFRSIAIAQGRRGSFSAASDEMRKQLNELGLGDYPIQIRDGSGLSRENYVTAEFLYALLSLWQNDSRFMPLISLLPVSGESGTLRYRQSVQSPLLKGKVLAKTGYVNGVSNLAGFIKQDNHFIPFVHLINGVVFDDETRAKIRQRKIPNPLMQAEKAWLESLVSAPSNIEASSAP